MAKGHNENHAKEMSYFRRFLVKDPRHSETIFAKKRYTSVVARALLRKLWALFAFFSDRNIGHISRTKINK